jgi:hypothetical protein
MTSSSSDPGSADSPPRGGEGEVEETLIAAVKSAILDRLLDDLRNDRPLGAGRSVYTKSDSGLYGKYEKQDDVHQNVLAALRATLEGLIDEHDICTRADLQPPSHGTTLPGAEDLTP